ncbi:DUF1642 domain-containing protein [Lactococcus lactis]|uniref:DUF1642 domain-containing protein n=1 Tax=Lactococcus lactis TaxID=1358 RepID=A0A443LHP5_9LACT|nr:DUF1642 domain-containing protein [Lactococcus lactis]NYZ58383.1 DUF1642 domain-containing protein [Lactococcus lactis]RWR48648.1 DUF1642 domain-containing protein [Lactococcus lactis]
MTKFEEEVKRPANGPLTELNNNMQEVFSQYRKMRQYADYLEYDSKQKDEYILKLENENSFMRDERTTFDSNGMAVEPKLQQQALPVVPECVDIWIKKCQELNWMITDVLAPESWSSEFAKDTENWLKKSKENFNLLALAFITGKYTVEKSDKCMVKLGALYFKCWNEVDAVFIIDDQPGAYESAFVFNKREDAEKVAQLVGGRVVKN